MSASVPPLVCILTISFVCARIMLYSPISRATTLVTFCVGFYKFGGTGTKTNIGAITAIVLIASCSATINTVPHIAIVIRSQTKTSARCTWITTCRAYSFISSSLINYNTITIACTTYFRIGG